ncbi:site-specific DNA-methyltransferase [Sulfurimonas paralvinellae]|uniref:site-specific DNA-methyltransferase (adenine-specific) n=1 Tax=Sulfurimonas paralvinellae TaxID=317658 RepID=A0A7M1B740_9BACT|nr:site-specific DNA-methyltransferase [Sulfurimonas paralvinellae]QOP45547.1 site-specific DNA-methyltransferase [Sulfurimonas paralvinellae]
MKKLDGKSLDIVSENVEKLKELFPEIFEEGKIDFEKLQNELGKFIDKEQERYNFTWNGKQEAKKIAQTPSTGTLRPAPNESKNWDTTQNLYIEGDNLEVLKLLQKSYHKKVKMIYIDPPYNTGKDFVYKDNFKDNIKNYLEVTGQVDSEGNRLSTNSDTNGRYHSDWLSMMYPRLKLARNLLKDDGVIFISIDDNEVANLRKLCDEIFGEDNFVGNIIWQHSIQGKGYGGKLSIHHNHILVFSKNTDFELGMFKRTEEDNKNYSNPDNDPNGDWRTGDVRNALDRPNLKYNITTPSGNIIKHPDNGWRWSKETLNEKIKSGEIIFNEDETRIIRKIYLKNQEGRVPESIFDGKKFGTTRDGTTELKDLFNKPPFDTPKPTLLIRKIMELNCHENDFILDFFSGSATTAHAVMQLNAEDGGKRKYICVQIPEPTDEKSEAYKAGYKNICEIGKERIRRAGEKIIVDNPDKDLSNLDIGFKVFKLDSSNIKEWDSDFDNLEQNLLDATENIKEDRTSEDLLYEILLKYGLDLTLPIEEKIIDGKKVFIIGFGALVVCLDDNITTDIVEQIADLKEEYETEVMRVVFKDSSFKDAVVKTNAIQILKQHGIDEVVSV